MAREQAERIHVDIRKGDQVRVTSGGDKGKTGRVLSVDAIKRTVTVEHARMIKRHTRPNPAKNIKGGIVEREAPIAVSNVMLVCPSCNKPTRVGHHVEWDTVKVTHADGSQTEHKKRRLVGRTCRRCGTSLEK